LSLHECSDAPKFIRGGKHAEPRFQRYRVPSPYAWGPYKDDLTALVFNSQRCTNRLNLRLVSERSGGKVPIRESCLCEQLTPTGLQPRQNPAVQRGPDLIVASPFHAVTLALARRGLETPRTQCLSICREEDGEWDVVKRLFACETIVWPADPQPS
jgi:hypothetical protein